MVLPSPTLVVRPIPLRPPGSTVMELPPSTIEQPPSASFAEVLRLVRSGQQPPGVRNPHASPTGDSPTASRLPPPTKPWESRHGQPPALQHDSKDNGSRNVHCSQHLENKEPSSLSTQQPGGSSDIG
ncbi:uncharacterized protein C6orf226 homolog [Cuculus canorus]|uniref:uncharacterized protein C6orf226 homolog n=1 Tax=Cuculus canorus TaxID=55661 RepID=UPI0023AA5340|nr:uncharacterized protein C6orf226 homolog [Cuculus canorus]